MVGKDVAYINPSTGNIVPLFQSCEITGSTDLIEVTCVADLWKLFREGARELQMVCEKVVHSTTNAIFPEIWETGGTISVCADIGGITVAFSAICTTFTARAGNDAQTESATFKYVEGSASIYNSP